MPPLGGRGGSRKKQARSDTPQNPPRATCSTRAAVNVSVDLEVPPPNDLGPAGSQPVQVQRQEATTNEVLPSLAPVLAPSGDSLLWRQYHAATVAAEALKEEQLRCAAIEQENQALRLQVTKLENTDRKARRKVRTNNNTDDEDNEDDDDSSTSSSSSPTTGDPKLDKIIRTFGRKFVLLYQLFIDEEWFKKPNPLDFRPDDPARFEDNETRLKGYVAELYHLVTSPVERRLLLESQLFCDVFIHAANASVRSIIHKLRSSTAAKVFGLGHLKDYYYHRADRSDVQEFIDLVQWPGDPASSRKAFLPIHFPGGVQNMAVAFRCEQLAVLLRSILFGPTSILPHNLNNPNWTPVKSNGRSWKLKAVTPGLIAFGAVVAVFLHQPDQTLEAIGAESKYGYARAFGQIKEYILKAFHTTRGKEIINELFAFYNGIIFPCSVAAQASGPAAPVTDAEYVEDVEGALAELELS